MPYCEVIRSPDVECLFMDSITNKARLTKLAPLKPSMSLVFCTQMQFLVRSCNYLHRRCKLSDCYA